MTEKPTGLIIVCCHGIYVGGPTKGASESEWLIQPFQMGETPTFKEHITTALGLLEASPSSLLVFSGSSTRSETRKSEARSYLDLCNDNDFWGLDKKGTLRRKILLEMQALDSFANLLFSVMLFWNRTGEWPQMVTIVSHAFKEKRFMDLHVRAMRWPRQKVNFVGVDPRYMIPGTLESDANRAEEVRRGEMQRGIREWQIDPTGRGERMRAKRQSRNPWKVGQLFFQNEGERRRSGVQSAILGSTAVAEEVLVDGKQPWEIEDASDDDF